MEYIPALDIGSKVIFDNVRTDWRDVTLGIEYTIAGIDIDGEPYFIDDVGEPNYATWCYEYFHVVE